MSTLYYLKTVVLYFFWMVVLTANVHAQPYQDAMFLNKEMRAGEAAGPGGKIWLIVIVITALFVLLYFYKRKNLSSNNG